MMQAFQKQKTGKSAKQDSGEWYTPREIVEALGPFDLDPCSGSPRPFATAATHYDPRAGENGLLKPWHGMVWLNPPYGGATRDWLGRLVEHGRGIALLSTRSEALWWQEYAALVTLCCFHLRSVKFVKSCGTPGPSAMPGGNTYMAFGAEAADRLSEADLGLLWKCERVRVDVGDTPRLL